MKTLILFLFLSLSAFANDLRPKACNDLNMLQKNIDVCLASIESPQVSLDEVYHCSSVTWFHPAMKSCFKASKHPNITLEKMKWCNKATVFKNAYEGCLTSIKNTEITVQDIDECGGMSFSGDSFLRCLDERFENHTTHKAVNDTSRDLLKSVDDKSPVSKKHGASANPR